ncbi:hypothetical protein [Cyanobium sp. Morenito 9A2]|uniref:hypothetical protein n=1 Tax=Cyanobium sp. Morenito 9A2 TaxID=2823718 RepID=UPI0020CED148|nr:hypothetical protein [Cyanobium sp. Morenito 9A2]MCP9849550.1 hypothetical protein [Cyanobium sp. Morenito 9A2]
MIEQPDRLQVLVLTGGLIHLVNQLAVVFDLPEVQASGAEVGLMFTGVITGDAQGLGAQHQAVQNWLAVLQREDPVHFGAVELISCAEDLRPGWDLVCLNNLWQGAQRDPVERFGIATVVVGGDGLGLYYRTGRELRAILPSLLGCPIAFGDREVRYVLNGRQPFWHRPPGPAKPVSEAIRRQLFDALVASQRQRCQVFVQDCLERTPPNRPFWLCSVPNLAHQFPLNQLPFSVLERWLQQLGRGHGFDRQRDALLLIDHPKAPAWGSFGSDLPAGVSGRIRSAVPLEVLVRALEEAAPGRSIVVAGLSSALYGVRCLTGAAVVWLSLAPLWLGNRLYRRRPLEFLHRALRVRRMAQLTAQLRSDQ